MNAIRTGVRARRAFFLAALALSPPLASIRALQQGETAQDPPVESLVFPDNVTQIDRIVAVVGDTAILESELRLTLYQLQSEGARIPPEGSEQWENFARQVLIAQIDDLIFIQRAKRDGITPDPDLVEENADALYQRSRQQFGSDEEMMAAVEGSGMNMLQYREFLRGAAQAEVLRRQYRAELERRTDLPPVIVSEEEIEAFFAANAADQPPRPALVSFNQLVVTPTPSGESRDSLMAEVFRVQNELVGGEDFAVVARRHSDDEGTRDRGGELGWMSRDGGLVRPFADAAWRARPGATVGPVQTQFGLHIIKIERQRGSERFLRHILLRPEIGEEDQERARARAVEIADSLRAGVDPELLMGYFRDEVADENIRFDDVPVASLAGQFSGEAASALQRPAAGEVYGPFEMQRGGPTEFGVVHVLTYRPEGPVELEDVRDAIRQRLRTEKQIELLLDEIRANTFINVKL